MSGLPLPALRVCNTHKALLVDVQESVLITEHVGHLQGHARRPCTHNERAAKRSPALCHLPAPASSPLLPERHP